MTLVDASVWIDHLRRPNEHLLLLLQQQTLLLHPYALGEVAMGTLHRREATLVKLKEIRRALVAGDAEVLDLIERERLYGSGLGYVDAHLLASALLTPDCRLWTRDRRLHEAAERIGVAA